MLIITTEIAPTIIEFPITEEYALECITKGTEEPYDGRPATDNAHGTALGIMVDLCNREGIGEAFESAPQEVKVDIVETMAEIIRVGMVTDEVDEEESDTISEDEENDD